VKRIGWRTVAIGGGLLAGITLGVGAYFSAKALVELAATYKTIKDAR
jgi:hypothetical protein